MPGSTAPAQAPVVQPTTQAEGEGASGSDGRSTGFLIVVGAAVVAAGCIGSRRATRRQQPGEEAEPKSEQAVIRSFEPPVGARAPAATGSAAVAQRPAPRVEPRSTASLIETLSPQARLADLLDGDETHDVCEIACWRGYVTWQFIVESESLHEGPLTSPYFRAPGKRAPQQTERSLAAHAALVEQLVAAGWERGGYGEEWFAESFQRASA